VVPNGEPTLNGPSSARSGSIVTDEAGGSGGGGVALTVQPDSRTTLGVAEPSFTSTVQSAGGVDEVRDTRKFSDPPLVVMATPSVVIERFAIARPSSRRLLPSSCAGDGDRSRRR
jgi:hypothetical protein